MKTWEFSRRSLGHDTLLGFEAFQQLHRPAIIAQRLIDPPFASAASAFRPSWFAFWSTTRFPWTSPIASSGRPPPRPDFRADEYLASRAAHDLRQLRMRSLIERIPAKNPYRTTETDIRVASVYRSVRRRAFGTALSVVLDRITPTAFVRTAEHFDRQIGRLRRGRHTQAGDTNETRTRLKL